MHDIERAKIRESERPKTNGLKWLKADGKIKYGRGRYKSHESGRPKMKESGRLKQNDFRHS